MIIFGEQLFTKKKICIPWESRRCNWWWLSEVVTSADIGAVEPTEPKLPILAMEPILPWDPKGAVGGAVRSSTGLLTWLEPDMEPREAVLVNTLGGRQ